MKQMNITTIALLLLATASGCERNERQRDRAGDDQGRTGDTPPPRAENPQPTVSPDTTPTAQGQGQQTTPAREEIGLKAEREAKADFTAAKGQKIDAEAELRELPTGVQLTIKAEDAPAGTKAVSIYEKGSCADMEAASMGKPFTPQGVAKEGG